jgi:hypothetical protein
VRNAYLLAYAVSGGFTSPTKAPSLANFEKTDMDRKLGYSFMAERNGIQIEHYPFVRKWVKKLMSNKRTGLPIPNGRLLLYTEGKRYALLINHFIC